MKAWAVVDPTWLYVLTCGLVRGDIKSPRAGLPFLLRERDNIGLLSDRLACSFYILQSLSPLF